VATTYPWANVTGMDLVPPALISKDNIPCNLRFEIDDANLRMDHYTDMFSVVHARTIAMGLNDVNSFFYQVAQTLKTGGVFFMVDALTQVRDENLKPFPFVEPGEPGFTWFQYCRGQAAKAGWHRGCRVYKQWWKEWLESNPNYSEVRHRDLDIPIGAWKESQCFKLRSLNGLDIPSYRHDRSRSRRCEYDAREPLQRFGILALTSVGGWASRRRCKPVDKGMHKRIERDAGSFLSSVHVFCSRPIADSLAGPRRLDAAR